MKAMIFAAGLGTRLRPLTDTMPKALVEVDGTPLLGRVIGRLKEAGYDEFVVNVHHFPDMIAGYLSDRGNFGVDVSISDERDCLLETGGGILKAEPFLKDSGRFLVHNVDILSNLDFRALEGSVRNDDLATLVVSERKTSRYLLFDDGMRLVGWTNTTTGEVRSPFPDLDPAGCRRYAFSGIHIISDRVFDEMRAFTDNPRFPIMDFYLSVAARCSIRGYVPDGLRLLDVGKADSLAAAASFCREIGQ